MIRGEGADFREFLGGPHDFFVRKFWLGPAQTPIGEVGGGQPAAFFQPAASLLNKTARATAEGLASSRFSHHVKIHAI